MTKDKEEIVQQAMRALAKAVNEDELRQEEETGTYKPNGKWEKGKLPISPTRMSTNQANYAQLKFTRIVNDIDEELSSEGWAVKDGRGKRVAGRSFVMGCLTDLMIAACEAEKENPSEFKKELEEWKRFATRYIKERRRVRDFFPKK